MKSSEQTIVVDGKKVKVTQEGFKTLKFDETKNEVQLQNSLGFKEAINFKKWKDKNPTATYEERIAKIKEFLKVGE